MEGLERLCKNARCQRLRRGQAVFCSIGKGKDYQMPMLEKGEVCIATTFYSTGHSNPDVTVELDKMKNCSYRT